MNLTSYVENNFYVLYYAADDKLAKNFLITLYTIGQSYSERHNYHISKNITATNLIIHPDLHSIQVTKRFTYCVIYTYVYVLILYYGSMSSRNLFFVIVQRSLYNGN